MRLSKSFRLLRFLNAQPPWPIRGALALVGGLATLVFTASGRLARQNAGHFWTAPTIKDPMRRLAWYGARSWLRIEPLEDPVFDFAAGLDAKSRAALARFLDRRPQEALQRHLDQLTLHAAAVVPPMPGAQFDTLCATFATEAAAVFDVLDTMDVPDPPKAAPARAGDFAVDDARQALADFAALFPNDQVPWYIISGTFLGLTREGGFLAHDYDIDLGIHAEDADLTAIAARCRDSDTFALVANDDLRLLVRAPDRSITQTHLPILLKLVHRTGVHVDLFVHYLEDGLRWHGSYVHRWDNLAFDLTRVTFEGVSVLAPADADQYLRENYGDWRTPVTAFSPSTGTPNLTVVHNLASVVLAIKRYALARTEGDPQAARLVEILVNANYAQRTDAGIRLNLTRF